MSAADHATRWGRLWKDRVMGARPLPCPIELSVLEQLIKREPDVFGDLTEQDWGDVSTLMKRNRCASACGIPENCLCDPR